MMTGQHIEGAAMVSRRWLLRAGLVVGATMSGVADRWTAHAAQEESGRDEYAHPAWLVDADWLLARQDDPGLRLIAFTAADEFASGHIPGAPRVDGPALELGDTSPAAVARWRDEMARLMAALGIERANTVVAYDAGSLFATRPWWVLRFLGHEDVRILNGGLAAWEAAGGTVAIGAIAAAGPATPAAEATDTGTGRPELLAPLAQVAAALDDPGVVFVDARTPEEYAAGHIPGAVNVNYPRNAAPAPPKVWKSAAELRAMYEALGVTSDKRIIPYCRTGVRSSVTDFTLRLLGYEDVALFTGSWNEWVRHPELPITTGSQP